MGQNIGHRKSCMWWRRCDSYAYRNILARGHLHSCFIRFCISPVILCFVGCELMNEWINNYKAIVAAPGRQGSQVISSSLKSWGRSSVANAGAVKEPGHFEVRKSQVTGCIFSHRLWKWLPFFSCHHLTTPIFGWSSHVFPMLFQ